MRAVICRVDRASVQVEGQTVGRIGRGLLAYVGVMQGDDDGDARWLAEKLVALRLFSDEAGKMNLSAGQTGGALLLVPNFTLAGRTGKGTRPSYSDAAAPSVAQQLFEKVAASCAAALPTAMGRFGAHMTIDARFDGPVTVILDSRPS
jgi:D-aminoacyl-tRNA deacylase